MKGKVFQFPQREQQEFDQRLELVEQELSQVRLYLELSPRQRRNYLRGRYSPREYVMRMIEELSGVYERLPG